MLAGIKNIKLRSKAIIMVAKQKIILDLAQRHEWIHNVPLVIKIKVAWRDINFKEFN